MSDCGNVKKTFVPSKPNKTLTPSPKGFDVSDVAVAKIKYFLTQEKKSADEYGLKISVVKDGCSGNSYTMDIAAISPCSDAGDKIFVKNGSTIIVEKLSYLFVIGSILDFKETLLASGFELSNPNIKKSCSCGSSFSV